VYNLLVAHTRMNSTYWVLPLIVSQKLIPTDVWLKSIEVLLILRSGKLTLPPSTAGRFRKHAEHVGITANCNVNGHDEEQKFPTPCERGYCLYSKMYLLIFQDIHRCTCLYSKKCPCKVHDNTLLYISIKLP
jgi:hypothetical protein